MLRESDLIYRQNILALFGTLPIQKFMDDSIIPPGLQGPRTIIGDDNIIFGELIGWGTQEAINQLSGYVIDPVLIDQRRYI